jgi:hypothetical protein
MNDLAHLKIVSIGIGVQNYLSYFSNNSLATEKLPFLNLSEKDYRHFANTFDYYFTVCNGDIHVVRT